MLFDETTITRAEKAAFTLRALYHRYGYIPYRMGKFEEYDLYSRNKDFLVSDSVITFTDTNGRLMALKPDVTLSIVKNYREGTGGTEKLYYDENVYRVYRGSGSFREIRQVGLECIGVLDTQAAGEVLTLAARSLEAVSPDYVLDISHLGLLQALLDGVGEDETLRRSVDQRIDVVHHGLGEGIGAEAGDEQLGRTVLVQILERVADMRTVGDHHAQMIAERVLRGMAAGLIGGAVSAQYALVGSDVIRHENVGDGAESDAAGAFEAGLEAPAVQAEGDIAQGESRARGRDGETAPPTGYRQARWG